MQIVPEVLPEHPPTGDHLAGPPAWAAPTSSAAEAAQRALNVFSRLSAVPDEFMGSGWTAEDVFWSRYFWFRVHSLLTMRLRGNDAGLKQQGFKILEHPEPTCEPDWTRLEEVEALATALAKRCP